MLCPLNESNCHLYFTKIKGLILRFSIDRYLCLPPLSKTVRSFTNTLKKYPAIIHFIGRVAQATFGTAAILLVKKASRPNHIKLYNTIDALLKNRVTFVIFLISSIVFIDLAVNLLRKVQLRIKGYIRSLQRQKLVKILKAWLSPTDEITSNKSQACRAIIKAFDDRATYLSFSKLGLNSLPPIFGFFKDLKSLVLSDNAFTDIPPEISCLSKLEALYLESNQIENIPEPIYSLLQLKKLNLCSNRITHISPKIGQFQELRSLILARNQITRIPPEIAQLQKLDYLLLNENQITRIPPEIAQLQKLTHLSLSANQITHIPPEIGQFQGLNYLDLALNQITDIPPEIAQLQVLTNLILSLNQITRIPPEIGQLQSLRELFLHKNQITCIPSEIGQLQRLRYLQLDDNQITYLPIEIGQPQKLACINLCHNRLLSIPREICGLRELEILRISDNPSLSDLPVTIGQLPYLERLLTDGTQIPSHVVPQILQACRSARDNIGRESFIVRARSWVGVSALQDDQLADKWQNKFNDGQKFILTNWLLKLEKAADFANNQKSLASTVCQIIQAVIDHPSFSETFWDQVRANNACCGDRAAMALNELYTSYMIHTLATDQSLKDQLQIIERTAKTLALRRYLANLIDQKQKSEHRVDGESVEIFLYYESQLQKDLHLLTAIQNMKYSEIGQRDWIDRKQLIDKVEKSYLDDLVKIPAFLKIIEEDSEFQKIWSAKEDSYMNQLIEEDEKKPLNCSKDDKAYLDWACKLGEIQKQREQEKNTLMKQWFLKKTRL